jgi:glutamate-1-semialdehyde 2,1-aminomutase
MRGRLAVLTAYLPTDLEFLRRVRSLCTEHGTLLVFDEIVTGFRVALGGAQGRLGVLPDVTTLGKAWSSGFPISAVGATRAVWDATIAAGMRPAGTFNGHAICVAAANGALETFEADHDVFPTFERLGAKLAAGLRAAAAAVGAPVVINQLGPVLFMTWGVDGPIETYRQVCESDVAAMLIVEEEFNRRGVLCFRGARWYLSAAHTDDDVEETIAVARGAFTSTMERVRARTTLPPVPSGPFIRV